MDIFLVRHGEAASSWGESRDPGLSELGHSQAEEAAHELLSLTNPAVRIISSPLLRAQETAIPLAHQLGGREVDLDAAFSEIPSPVPLAERQGWLRQFMQQRWDEQPEELHSWRKGMMESLLRLTESTVVFTHFLVMNTVVGQVQGRAETLCFWPDNASIVRLRHTGENLELVELGRQMSTVVN